MSQLRQEMYGLRQDISQSRQEMREQFRWILGFQVLSWISPLGVLQAYFSRR